MLYVDIPTHADLVSLATERTPAAVTICLPTTPVSRETGADRIALKNMAREAADQLAAAGHDKREIAAIGDILADIEEDDQFWSHQAHSLVIFATPTGARTFRVPNALTALVEVADRFHVKPLLRAVTFPNGAYVLALAEGGVHLLEISPDLPVSVVSVPGLPKDAASAVGVSSLSVRTESRRSDSASGQRARLVSCCRQVDRALRPLLSGQHVPLFLAADPALGAIYRTVNSYPHLAGFGIDQTPDPLTDTVIADATRPLLDRLYAEELAAIRDEFDRRANSGRATTDISSAARAATMGAIATLLVDIDTTVPGTVDEESGAVSFADAETASNYGIVDEIARRALLSGARVLGVRAVDLPSAEPLAAILRYPV